MNLFANYLLDELCHVVNSYLSPFEQSYFIGQYEPYTGLDDASEEQMLSLLQQPPSNKLSFIFRACELNSLAVLKNVFANELTLEISHGLKDIDKVEIWKWIYEQCMINNDLTANMRSIFKPYYIRNVEMYEWFKSMGLIRNMQKVIRSAIQHGEMDFVVHLDKEGFRGTWSDYKLAANRGHLHMIEYAYDDGMVEDYSQLMSLALVHFPSGFERLVDKLQITTLTQYHFYWNNEVDRNRKLELFRYAIQQFHFEPNAMDIAFLCKHNICFPFPLKSLPRRDYLSLEELVWIEQNAIGEFEIDRPAIGEFELDRHAIGTWECVVWYLDHGLTLNTHTRLIIISLAPTQEDFDNYVNRDVVYKTEWYNHLIKGKRFAWMMRYIMRERFDFVTNKALFLIDNEQYHMEAIQFLARDTGMLRVEDLLPLYTKSFDILLDIFALLRHRLPLVDVFCQFVRDKERMVQFLQVFPDLDLTHPEIVKKSKEYRQNYLSHHLLCHHPELFPSSKKNWGFDLKRKRQ